VLHDDLHTSAAFCTVLDDKEWGMALSVVVEVDPLATCRQKRKVRI